MAWGGTEHICRVKDLCFVLQVGEMKYKGIIVSEKKIYVPTFFFFNYFLKRVTEVSFISEAH